jgi:hypothetical protein
VFTVFHPKAAFQMILTFSNNYFVLSPAPFISAGMFQAKLTACVKSSVPWKNLGGNKTIYLITLLGTMNAFLTSLINQEHNELYFNKDLL